VLLNYNNQEQPRNPSEIALHAAILLIRFA
jgi:hypothetical protein